jgi:hypothetical protein
MKFEGPILDRSSRNGLPFVPLVLQNEFSPVLDTLDGAFDGTGFRVGLTGAEAGHQRDEKDKQSLAVHTNQRFFGAKIRISIELTSI